MIGTKVAQRGLLCCVLVILLAAAPSLAQKTPSRPASTPSGSSTRSAAASAAGARDIPARPKLVVLLVVDQMRADYIENFRQQWKGGLARLVNEGAWFRAAAYPYMTTVTCAGHTTISTGAFPATSGVVANSWYDRDEEGGAKSVTCTADSHFKNIGYGGETSGGDSPMRLRITTFSDALREQAGGGTRVVAFSMKARAAVTLAGHHADAVAWHDEKTGVWTTSSYYGASEFVADYARAHPVSADYGKGWSPSLPAAAYLYDDSDTGRRPPAGWTTDFPHPLRGLATSTGPDAAYYTQWETSPFSDAYLAKMAEAAVDSMKLGQGKSTDFLAVSFSALDKVGHALGPHSHEVQDVLARLDGDLGELFADLDAKVGRANYVVAFSADHGVAPVPELAQKNQLGGGRVSNAAIRRRVNQICAQWITGGNAVASIDGNNLSFVPGAYEKLREQSGAVDAIIHEIESTPGVLRVFRSEQLYPLPQTADPILRAASLSYVPGRSGDLIIALKPYWIPSEVSASGMASDGTTHGSPYLYDQRVPVIFYGAGIRPGAYADTSSPADIAPTLAYLCGITLARVDGHVLANAVTDHAQSTLHAPSSSSPRAAHPR